MSNRTYTTKIQGREIAMKMKKDLAKDVCKEIERALKVPGNWIELTGIIGGEEHRTQLWSPFGGAPVGVSDPDGYKADCDSLLGSLPALVDESNMPAIVASARALFKKHLPVYDCRVTAEVHTAEVTERNQMVKRHEEERAAALSAQIAKHGESDQPVNVPEGFTAVVVQLHYNNSDSMTDYFDSNSPHGPEYILDMVPGRPVRKEVFFRGIVAKYLELESLKWTWNKEEYSMGHGTWLESEVVETLDGLTTYGGNDDPGAWWEVSLGYGKQFVPFRGYTAAHSAKSATPADVTAPAPVSNGSYTLTIERDWSWISFPCKPAAGVLETLKSHGGRWGKRRSAWYFTRHLTESEVAQWMGAPAPEVTPEPEPAPIVEEMTPEPVIVPSMEDITPAPAAVDLSFIDEYISALDAQYPPREVTPEPEPAPAPADNLESFVQERVNQVAAVLIDKCPDIAQDNPLQIGAMAKAMVFDAMNQAADIVTAPEPEEVRPSRFALFE